jgi:pimeloyl-ACP methyl ester carboxylesterase
MEEDASSGAGKSPIDGAGQPTNPQGDLDLFLDDVLAQTGAPKVYAIGHSRGTSVWTSYLDDSAFDAPDKM